MIASTRIKSDDDQAAVVAKASKKKAQKKAETFTKAEQGIREMLDAKLNPRECVSMPLEIPRGINMMNFHERLSRTLAMICSEEVEVVPQDNSYRKVFIRFGRGKSLAVENGVDGQAATGNDNGKMRMELEAQMSNLTSQFQEKMKMMEVQMVQVEQEAAQLEGEHQQMMLQHQQMLYQQIQQEQ